jgi:hypothetical protein
MQNHSVTLLNKKLRGHSTQPIGRPRNENARHFLFSLLSDRHRRYIPLRNRPLMG